MRWVFLMYRVELKDHSKTLCLSHPEGQKFLMYRVELKDHIRLKSQVYYPAAFLMYRVELKASKEILCASLKSCS